MESENYELVNNVMAAVLGEEKFKAFAMISVSGLTPRLMREDTREYPVTPDVDPSRINLEVDFGAVTRVYKG